MTEGDWSDIEVTADDLARYHPTTQLTLPLVLPLTTDPYLYSYSYPYIPTPNPTPPGHRR